MPLSNLPQIGLIRLFPATLSQAGSGNGAEQLATRHALRMQKRAHQFGRAITSESEWRTYFLNYDCDLSR